MFMMINGKALKYINSNLMTNAYNFILVFIQIWLFWMGSFKFSFCQTDLYKNEYKHYLVNEEKTYFREVL